MGRLCDLSCENRWSHLKFPRSFPIYAVTVRPVLYKIFQFRLFKIDIKYGICRLPIFRRHNIIYVKPRVTSNVIFWVELGFRSERHMVKGCAHLLLPYFGHPGLLQSVTNNPNPGPCRAIFYPRQKRKCLHKTPWASHQGGTILVLLTLSKHKLYVGRF